MGSPNQFSGTIQLKFYQAFLFSIAVFFSIILVQLFYLFYLKARTSTSLSTPPVLPTTSNHANITPPCDSDLNNEVKKKLCRVLFNEHMKARNSLCCVCLGEFKLKEELVQVPTCKHTFHIDCICHWLKKYSTCPLCRAPVLCGTDINM